MTPAVQRWIAAALVFAALAYVAVRAWRQVVAARRARGCGPGCGCD
jgi:hypothetical protein